MNPKKALIFYTELTDEMRKETKLNWFRNADFDKIPFERIAPDKNANWINLTNNDFENLMPVCTKETKLAKSKKDEKAIFKLYSLGVVTARDEWVYDFDKNNLINKVDYFSDFFKAQTERWQKSDKSVKTNDFVDRTIKWTSELENYLKRGTNFSFNSKFCRISTFRPFVKKHTYFSKIITHRLYQNEFIFGINKPEKNTVISFLGMSSSHEISILASQYLIDAGLLKQGNGITQCLPFYRYESGEKTENITDWALGEFRKYYGVDTHGGAYVQGNQNADKNNMDVDTHGGAYVQGNGKSEIQKMDIFHYVYGVLHNPAYRTKYEQNLKRDFPRIPFYSDFWKWANWGKKLMDLHLNYETVNTHRRAYLQRHDTPLKNPEAVPKAKLRRDKKTDEIILDEITVLSEIPSEAWEYKLGNRSALEWILDQYKEKKPRDATIAEKFNTYQFADYKEDVIELLQQVCTVSVETMRIIREMEKG